MNLLHGLMFAVLALVMISAGEHVKTQDAGATSWMMRCSVAIAALGIASLAVSFVPAIRSNLHSSKKDRNEEIAKNLYILNGSELDFIRKDTVKNIEYYCRNAAYHAALQDVNDIWNKRLTYLSQATVVLSSLLFGIGVWLI